MNARERLGMRGPLAAGTVGQQDAGARAAGDRCEYAREECRLLVGRARRGTRRIVRDEDPFALLVAGRGEREGANREPLAHQWVYVLGKKGRYRE